MSLIMLSREYRPLDRKLELKYRGSFWKSPYGPSWHRWSNGQLRDVGRVCARFTPLREDACGYC